MQDKMQSGDYNKFFREALCETVRKGRKRKRKKDLAGMNRMTNKRLSNSHSTIEYTAIIQPSERCNVSAATDDKIKEAYKELVSFAEQKGCAILYDDARRISFSTAMRITVPIAATLETVYALAHEIGHLLDFLDGELDHDRWLNDEAYRVTAEMSAWVRAHKLLSALDISLDGYRKHVNTKLSTYFHHEQVI